MANEENLKKGIATRFRTGEEQARVASEGGKASVAARRKQKAMRTAMRELMGLPAECEEARAALEGIDLEGADNQDAMLAGLMKAGMAGDVKAVQEIRNILGESRDTASEKAERKARTAKLQAETAAAQAKVNGTEQDYPDDGFLDALRGEAADWNE